MHEKPVVPDFFSFRFHAIGGRPLWAWLIVPWGIAVLLIYRARCPGPLLNPAYWLAHCPPVWQISASALLRHLGHLGWLALFVALAVAWGRGMLRRLVKLDELNVFEILSFSFGLGVGTLALATFGLGAAQALKPAFVFGLAAFLAVAALWMNRDLIDRPQRAAGALFSPGSGILATATIFILLFDAYQALAPEISYDALVYHLALPGLYRLNGGLTATPTNLYSGFPMLMEWAYAFMLFFSDEISAKLIHWSCGLGAAAALLGLGVRSRRPLAGWAGCVIFFGMPMTSYNIVKAAVDMGGAYFILLTVISLARQLSLRESQPDTTGWLDLSAVFCGLAMGIKYTNWPLLPLLLIILGALKESRGNILRYGIIAACLAAPWALKNCWLYHNPVFPFLQEIFAPGWPFASAWRRLSADAWGRDWPFIFSHGPEMTKALLHPWFVTMNGFTEFDHIGPAFLAGLPALLWLRPAARESRLWLWSLLGLWLSWWLTTGMPRFFLPGLALLSVFLGAALDRVPGGWLRRGLALLLAGLALDAAAGFCATTSSSGNAEYLLQGAAKDAYLRPTRKVYPNSYFKAAQWINRHAPAAARVLVLNGGRGYYLERPFLASSQLDEDLLAHWLKRSRSADELLRELQGAGVTHLLINMAWIWRSDPDPAVTPASIKVLEDFFNAHARLRFNDVEPVPHALRWVLVYELGPAQQPSRPVLNPLLTWYKTGGLSGLGAQGGLSIEYHPGLTD